MKKIVLVALLAAAGCSKKASSSGSECDAPINKGMDSFAATVKTRGSGSPMAATMLGVVEKLRTTFIQRCHEDKWAPEAAACFGTVSSQPEVKACEQKLTEEQRTKLTSAVREVMMSSMRMPGGVPGHPQALKPSNPGATPGSADGSAAPPAAAPPATEGAPAPAAGSGSAAAPAGGGW